MLKTFTFSTVEVYKPFSLASKVFSW